MDLFFQGGAGDLFLSEDSSAEERIKSLLGDAADRGRRRIVRRRSARAGTGRRRSSSPSATATVVVARGDPLSELLAHLAASRRAATRRAARGRRRGWAAGSAGWRRLPRRRASGAASASTCPRRTGRRRAAPPARAGTGAVLSAMVDEPTIGETLGGAVRARVGERQLINQRADRSCEGGNVCALAARSSAHSARSSSGSPRHRG